MRKTVLIILSVVLLVQSLAFPIDATEKSFSWYCAHAKNHVQPQTDSTLLFVEDYDGFYIDHKHTNSTDAEKVIYLTFDAGYENGNVEKILDVLREEKVPAAFFVLANLIEKNGDLILRMATEGHMICNHTARHKDMSQLSNLEMMKELHTLESMCYEKTGVTLAKYYRPPEGRFSKENLACVQKNGYKTIFWSFAYPDWDNQKQLSPEKAKSIILENAHNGEVMLLHPTSETNAIILGDIIQSLKSDGYRFGTLDELTQSN